MSRTLKVVACLYLCMGPLALVEGAAQNFGSLTKEKIVLQRKLPALVRIPGPTIKVKVTAHPDQTDIAPDLETQLQTELTKDDSRLSVDDSHPAAIITCEITNFTHPPPKVEIKPVAANTRSSFNPLSKAPPKNATFTRITGSMSVSFQAKLASGRTLISDNVSAKYDDEFDSSGNSTTHGVMGSLSGAFTRVKGGNSEEMNPPTDAELRARLMQDVVKQIAAQMVDTTEILEIYLARGKGALDDGNKQAEAGLWQRALETYETAQASPRPDEDAYRLYDIGVAYEALAYQAEDSQSAMKFLDQAAINYGKAVDSKPSEKYFLEPQKRIETAIVHYKQLEEQKQAKAEAAAAASKPAIADDMPAKPATGAPVTAKSAGPKPLSNAQIITMIKSGLDDDTVIQTIHAAKVTAFNLSATGRKDLTTNGISAQVVAAMQSRTLPRKPAQ